MVNLEKERVTKIVRKCFCLILGQYRVLPGTLPGSQTSEKGGGGHHEQHPPYLQHQVAHDQEGVDEGSQAEK